MFSEFSKVAKRDGLEFGVAFSEEYTRHRSGAVATGRGVLQVLNLHRQERIESKETDEPAEAAPDSDHEVD